MKKFLAVIMALIMSFSVALVPVCAAEAEVEKEQVTVEEVFSTIENAVLLIKDTIEQVHNIVGQILGVLDKECPMCGAIHELATEGDDVVEEEIPEEEVTEAIAA